jgi:hypothetical protein
MPQSMHRAACSAQRLGETGMIDLAEVMDPLGQRVAWPLADIR